MQNYLHHNTQILHCSKPLCIQKGNKGHHISITNMVKKCPKCNIYVYKTYGAIFVTHNRNLGGCGHEFCWLCFGDWSEHGSRTGGYYICRIYEKRKLEGLYDEEPKNSMFNIVYKVNTIQE